MGCHAQALRKIGVEMLLWGRRKDICVPLYLTFFVYKQKLRYVVDRIGVIWWLWYWLTRENIFN